MAKRKRAVEKKMTRRQQSRKERDERIQRYLTLGAAALGVLVVLIIGFGLINEYVIKARRPVAQVGDTKITTKAYQARQSYQRIMTQFQLTRYQNMLSQFNANDPSQQYFYQQIESMVTNLENQLSPEMAEAFGEQVLGQMVEEELVFMEAQERNLTVPQDEIEEQVELMMGYDRNAVITETETLTGTDAPMTEAEYEEAYDIFKESVLQSSGFSEAKYRELLKAGLLIEELQDILAQDIITVADQVQVVYLAVGTEEAAQAIKERLDMGDDPEIIVEELLADEDSESMGQTLPWFPVDSIATQLGPEFEAPLLNTPVGQATEPVEASGRYYLLYVLGREERPLSMDLIEQEKQQEYEAWLAEQEEAKVERFDWEKAVITEP